jgi:hypothetical protein
MEGTSHELSTIGALGSRLLALSNFRFREAMCQMSLAKSFAYFSYPVRPRSVTR